jgi:hypothetical protein
MNPKRPKRVALYLRVSTSEQTTRKNMKTCVRRSLINLAFSLRPHRGFVEHPRGIERSVRTQAAQVTHNDSPSPSRGARGTVEGNRKQQAGLNCRARRW